jgi:hypothetical protein
MSANTLSSKMRAAALSLSLLAGTAGPSTAFADTGNVASNSNSASTQSYQRKMDAVMQAKMKTWTVNAPRQAEAFKRKASHLYEKQLRLEQELEALKATPGVSSKQIEDLDERHQDALEEYFEAGIPKNLYKNRMGGPITFDYVVAENENAMRHGKMLAAVAVIVPEGATRFEFDRVKFSNPLEWFKTTEHGQRMLGTQREMALTSLAFTKENGGFIERIYLVEHPEGEPLNLYGKEYESENAIVILMGDQFPIIQHTINDAGSMAYAMFESGNHVTPPTWYEDVLGSVHNDAQVNNTDKAGGEASGGGQQQQAPDFASLDQ